MSSAESCEVDESDMEKVEEVELDKNDVAVIADSGGTITGGIRVGGGVILHGKLLTVVVQAAELAKGVA
jgi:hypothetical protein